MNRQARGCPGDAAPDPRGPFPDRLEGAAGAPCAAPSAGTEWQARPSPPARRQPRRVALQGLYSQACSARFQGARFLHPAVRQPPERQAMAFTGHEIGPALACRHVKPRVATGWNYAITGAQLTRARESLRAGKTTLVNPVLVSAV